jgi:hypothetical protein
MRLVDSANPEISAFAEIEKEEHLPCGKMLLYI